MKKFSFIAVLIVLVMTVSAFATVPFMPRHPALSPNGEMIVFSFQGDLWSVDSQGGKATRLTANPGYDSHPVFSKNGNTIAFSSNRQGDRDVFLLPSEGGIPTRLTFAGTADTPYDFSPDGSTLYYTASHLFDYPMDRQIMQIPVTGGTPFRLADIFGHEVSVSADGNTFIIASGRVKFGRVHYRGSYQREIYSFSPGTDPIQITTHNGFDIEPHIANDGRIFYVTDDNATKTNNVWVMNTDGSDKRQITNFEGDGVRTISVSADGNLIVIERATKLYVMAGEEGTPEILNIDVAADQLENLVYMKNISGGAEEVTFSDDGEEIAMVVHGEIVLVNTELEGRAVVPIPSPARDFHISFRPGSADTLSFVTDRFGNRTVCLLVSDDKDESNLRLAKSHKIVPIGDKAKTTQYPSWSPDGKNLAFLEGHGDLHIVNADGKKDKTLWKSFSEFSYSWSPDSRWMALSPIDFDYNSDIWIVPVDGKQSDGVNISQHPDDDLDPVWSADGKALAWSSRRHDNEFDGFFVYLTREDDERTKEEWEIWEKTRDKKKKTDSEDDKDKEEEDKEEEFKIDIDFDDIHLRSRRLTSLPGDEFMVGIHPKTDKFYFLDSNEGTEDIYAVNRFGKDKENITEGADPEGVYLDNKGETFYFIKGGKPASVSADGGKVETTSFKARIKIDKPAERVQIVDEGWRIMKNDFYDPNMHGVDWDGLRDKYKDWASKVAHDYEFDLVVNYMLGELNASHMGYYQDWDTPYSAGDDGALGIEYDPTYAGKGLKVKWVLPHSPADVVANRVLAGDIILSINGEEVSSTKNVFQPLTEQKGLPVEVELKRGKETIEVILVPIKFRSLRQLTYEYMEKKNRNIVEEKSADKVGYLHIQGMSMAEVERFEMNLFAAANDKEALVIDVRNNGGGWTTDMLLTILTQPVHAYTIGRDGGIGYPQPRYPMFRWRKPIVVLCNEGSYSNAEIFSHAIQTIGRGPVVGNVTGGNVISTGGWETLDGGWIRLPGRGWYIWGDEKNNDRNHMNQEIGGQMGTGVQPDYIVPFTLSDRMHDRDPQLDKAIELMLEAIDSEPFKQIPTDSPHLNK